MLSLPPIKENNLIEKDTSNLNLNTTENAKQELEAFPIHTAWSGGEEHDETKGKAGQG